MDLDDNRITIGKGVFLDDGIIFTSKPMMLKVENGQRRRVEAKARIVIEDNVNIGANSVINLGVKNDTVIKKGVFIGHLATIGHDSVIGEHTIVGAQACVLGEVVIGKWCFIASQSVIKPGVKIGDRTMIGMGSVVTRDIRGGVIAYGSPAKIIRKNLWRPDE